MSVLCTILENNWQRLRKCYSESVLPKQKVGAYNEVTEWMSGCIYYHISKSVLVYREINSPQRIYDHWNCIQHKIKIIIIIYSRFTKKELFFLWRKKNCNKSPMHLMPEIQLQAAFKMPPQFVSFILNLVVVTSLMRWLLNFIWSTLRSEAKGKTRFMWTFLQKQNFPRNPWNKLSLRLHLLEIDVGLQKISQIKW